MPTNYSELPEPDVNSTTTPIPDQTTSPEPQGNEPPPEHEQDRAQAGQGGQEESSGTDQTEPLPVFRSPDGRLFSILNGRSYPIDSRDFRDAVRYTLLNAGDTPPAEADVRDFLGRLKIRAHAATVQDVFIRVAATPQALYLDLANARGEVVEVTAQGWVITAEAPVRFARPPGTLPLATPSRDGNYEELRRFVRLPEPAFHLLVATLAYQLRPVGPQPITVLLGEQGSAKSTLTKQLRRLIDPRSPEVRRPPGSTRDFMVAASRSWVLAYDNLSELKPWFSDALCTIASGGGFGARTGHTDGDETTFDARLPVILNGIDDFVRRDDLRDRCIVYELEAMTATERRHERGIWDEFTDAAPVILGGLLDLCSGALRELPNVATRRLPRMADFYQWALAVERAGGWLPGTIEQAYADQRRATDVDAMADPLAQAIEEFTSKQGTWSGTPAALLNVLETSVPRTARGASWPRSPSRFGGELRRLMDLLRRNGTVVELVRSGAQRTVRLEHEADHPNAPSLPSLPSPEPVPFAADLSGPVHARDDGDRSDGGAGASVPQEPPATAVALLAPPAGRPTAASSSSSPSQPPQGPAALGMCDDSGDRGHEERSGEMAAPTKSNEPRREAPGVPPRLLGSSEPARQRLPPRRRNIQDVLRGKQLTLAEVVEGLRQVGTLPNVQNPARYVGQELAYGVRDGHWTRAGRGVYTC